MIFLILCQDEWNEESHNFDLGEGTQSTNDWGIGFMGMGDATQVRRNVAVFLDMENLVGGNSVDATGLRLGELVTGIEDIVRKTGVGRRTAMIRAFAHWGSPVMAGFQREILGLGVEPVQIFSFDKQVKNAADIELCVDVLSVAHESPLVDVFVIATGDGGFVPLVRKLHAMGKYVVVVSTNDPESGVVNALLKSVADEYHQIPMSRVSAAAQIQPSLKPPSGTTSLAKVVPKVAAKALQKEGPPVSKAKNTQKVVTVKRNKIDAVAELRSGIRAIIKSNPELLISNRINAAALGSLLLREYPQLSYKACGSKTLSDFLKTYCSLGVINGGAAHGPAPSAVLPNPAKIPAPATTEPTPIPGPKFLLDAVRNQFTAGTLGHEVRASGADGLKLSVVGTQLRTAIAGFTSPNAGFPYLHQVLEDALEATEYRVVRSELRSTTVMHSSYA